MIELPSSLLVRTRGIFSSMDSQLTHVIDLPIAELQRDARDLSLAEHVRTYALVLAYYLQGDIERLEPLVRELPKRLSQTPENLKAAIEVIAQLRLKLRKRDFKKIEAETIQKITMPDVLEGEKEFCLGLGFEQLGSDNEAAEHFQKAAAIYNAFGAKRKALRAFYNTVAAESRVFPHKNFISEWQAIHELARAQNESAFSGMALSMISREYQILGQTDEALRMAEEALTDLVQERGSLHYFHAALHLAHVHIDMGNETEARKLMHESELANFREIHAARKLLLVAIDPLLDWHSKLEADLLPTWKNRIPKLKNRTRTMQGSDDKLSDLEQRLLKLAYNGPIDKWDLITSLYGDETLSLVLENRFKNLIGRLRKKHPGLIICEGGKYWAEKIPSGSLT